MTVKNILVAYPGWGAGQSPLIRALKIAAHHDAWVTGIVGHGTSQLRSLFGSRAPQEVIDALRKQEREEIDAAKTVFATMAEEYGRAHAAESLDVFDEDGATVASFARTFDLVVTAPASERRSDDHLSASPDLIALQSGRPVLIVPKGYDAPGLSTHVLVAWDGKRAAARAVGDAMTMLQDKGMVSVLTVGSRIPEGTARLVENLTRHGINARHLQRSRTGSVGATILATTGEVGADLIVMGAYEHSKFSHDMFGGVTTDVMKDTRVPVFMSH